MFGFLKGKPTTPGQAALEEMGGSEGGVGDHGKNDGGYKGDGFDPTGLERAARAAKVLDNSPNAKYALQVIQSQLETKAEGLKVKAAEFEAYTKQQEVSKVEKEAEEARRTLQAQTEQDKRRAEYRDQLDRKRYVDQINAERSMKEAEMKRQEELVQRQEAIKRKTLEYEAELRRKTELARVQAETEGNIKQERENHDLRMEEAKISSQEYRDTVLEAIKLAGHTLGTGIQEFLGDRSKMVAATTTVTAVALGIYTARTSTSVIGRYVEAQLGKPTLVRDTSRRSIAQTLKNPIPTLRRLLGFHKVSNALEGVVLKPSLESRLSRVATSTANTKRNRAPFRHLLLYGPPGTGKTLFAKGLARHSGLDYAIMTGGDISPLGRDAVTEMHKLFEWAQASKRGLLLFVDEADAFLRRRSTEHISEDLRNALNAFLYRTGESTDRFMLVYASNQPEQFDWAINDRIDEMVPFELPEYDERYRMLTLYMKKYLLNVGGHGSGHKPIRVTGVEDQHIMDVAVRTEGFSGREIAKLTVAWQAAAYGEKDSTFTQDMMMEVLENHLAQKKQKQDWESGARKRAQAKFTQAQLQLLTGGGKKDDNRSSTTS